MADQNWGRIYGITDKDYIEEFGLDPNLEGKPEINDAILKAVKAQEIKSRVIEGMSERQAQELSK